MHDLQPAAILASLADLNESRLCGVYGPIKESISEDMAEKVRLVQEIGYQMRDAQDNALPSAIPTRVAYSIVRSLEQHRQELTETLHGPAATKGLTERLPVPGKL